MGKYAAARFCFANRQCSGGEDPWIGRRYSVKEARDQAIGRQCSCYAHGNSGQCKDHGLTDHDSHNIPRFCAHRHSHADFMSPLLDGVGEDTVNADGCQQEGETSE